MENTVIAIFFPYKIVIVIWFGLFFQSFSNVFSTIHIHSNKQYDMYYTLYDTKLTANKAFINMKTCCNYRY